MLPVKSLSASHLGMIPGFDCIGSYFTFKFNYEHAASRLAKTSWRKSARLGYEKKLGLLEYLVIKCELVVQMFDSSVGVCFVSKTGFRI